MKHQGTQNRALADDALLRDSFTGTVNGAVVHGVTDIPLNGFSAPTIQGATSGVPFDFAVLPAEAKLLATEINIIEDISGGTMVSARATVQGAPDAAGAILASTDVFTGAPLGFIALPGSDAYQTRNGQHLQMTLTTGGDTPDHATTGHLEVHYYYVPIA